VKCILQCSLKLASSINPLSVAIIAARCNNVKGLWEMWQICRWNESFPRTKKLSSKRLNTWVDRFVTCVLMHLM